METVIEAANVDDAIIVYGLLQKNNVEIPKDLKQKLLELAAYYNSKSPSEDSMSGEFVDVSKRTEVSAWADGGFADQLFASFEEKTDAAYNAIIRGKSKYNQAAKAHQLYKEALEKGVVLNVTTFNYVLKLPYWLHDSSAPRWQMVQELLQNMNERRVRPNVGTLNAVLFMATKVGNDQQARTNCLQTLSAFHRLGVRPSLGSWQYVLSCFCRDRSPTSTILLDILDQVENREWQVETPNDYNFFATAMTVCRNHLSDPATAHRIHQLLNYGDNYDLIGNARKETVYYRNYLGVLLDSAPMEEFMSTYETIVPNLHCPEVGIMSAVLQNVDAKGAIEYLPKIWSDMIILQHANKSHLVQAVMNTMAQNKPIAEIKSHEGLSQKFATIVWDLYELIDEQPEWRQNKLEWDGPLLSNALTILCRADEFEKAEAIFNKCLEPHVNAVSVADADAIGSFVRLCIDKRKPTTAINALKYNVDNIGPEANIELGKLIVSSFTLSEVHLSRVTSLVGEVDVQNP